MLTDHLVWWSEHNPKFDVNLINVPQVTADATDVNKYVLYSS